MNDAENIQDVLRDISTNIGTPLTEYTKDNGRRRLDSIIEVLRDIRERITALYDALDYLMNEAPDNLDSIKEIIEFIQANRESIESINGFLDTVDNVITEDKVNNGYQLSKNDFTDELKAKLESVNVDGEANVQSDWLTTDVNSDSFIKNKPTEFTPEDHTHTFDEVVSYTDTQITVGKDTTTVVPTGSNITDIINAINSSLSTLYTQLQPLHENITVTNGVVDIDRLTVNNITTSNGVDLDVLDSTVDTLVSSLDDLNRRKPDWNALESDPTGILNKPSIYSEEEIDIMLSGIRDSITTNRTILATKADLINGKIPINQLNPTTNYTIKDKKLSITYEV